MVMENNTLSANDDILSKERFKIKYNRTKIHAHDIAKLHFKDELNAFCDSHFNYGYDSQQSDDTTNSGEVVKKRFEIHVAHSTISNKVDKLVETLNICQNSSAFGYNDEHTFEGFDQFTESKETSSLALFPSGDVDGGMNDASLSDDCSNSVPLISDFTITTSNLKNFVLQPAPRNVTMKCRITRNRRGVEKSIYPTYYLHLEDYHGKTVFLLAARRRKKSAHSNYLISCDIHDLKRDSISFVGKVRANLMCTNFVVLDYEQQSNSGDEITEKYKGFRRELSGISYDTNTLGLKSPRKMTVIIPGMNHNNERIEFYKIKDGDSLIERWRMNKIHNLLELHNKCPVWNNDSHSFVLNFNGRVTKASVKNFQIVYDNDVDYIVMQFGRVAKDIFIMDFSYPLCAFQAFGIALSSFDSKLEFG